MLAATTHEGALKAADLVLLPLRSWRDHIRASRRHISSRVPGPLILLCLSDRQAGAGLVEGHPWVPVGSLVGPRFLAGIRRPRRKLGYGGYR